MQNGKGDAFLFFVAVLIVVTVVVASIALTPEPEAPLDPGVVEWATR